MSFLGSLHVAAAVLALAVAAIVLVRTKGTTSHVRLGRIYVVLLVLVDGFALLTYQNGIGPFHLLAVISLATLTAGLIWSPRRRGSRQTHGILMIWSVAGLVGAGLAQGATAALPRRAHGRPWPLRRASVCLRLGHPSSGVIEARRRIDTSVRRGWRLLIEPLTSEGAKVYPSFLAGPASGVGDHELEFAAGRSGQLVAALDGDLRVSCAELCELSRNGLAEPGLQFVVGGLSSGRAGGSGDDENANDRAVLDGLGIHGRAGRR